MTTRREVIALYRARQSFITASAMRLTQQPLSSSPHTPSIASAISSRLGPALFATLARARISLALGAHRRRFVADAVGEGFDAGERRREPVGMREWARLHPVRVLAKPLHELRVDHRPVSCRGRGEDASFTCMRA
jgi:hypothetical protein